MARSDETSAAADATAGTTGTDNAEARLHVDGIAMVRLLGAQDRLLTTLEKQYPLVAVHVRGNEITLSGDAAQVDAARRLVEELLVLVRGGHDLSPVEVASSARIIQQGTSPAEVLSQAILTARGKSIRPKTLGQKQYVDAIDHNTIVFGIGPAGTGKTYLAMAKAVQALQRKEVTRIILSRPAIEAGERLGYLPGTLTDKIDPYLRPLYDALNEMMDPELVPKLLASGTIEVAPLAYMRGRAQPLDAQVLTPTGFVEIGALRVGDFVIGSDGDPTPVIGVFPQGRKPVYRVVAQDGASTLCCGEHLWTVVTRDDKRRGKSRVLQTSEMMGRLRQNHFHRYELPIVRPVQMPERPVPLDPYALGLLLGDGSITCRTTPSFSTADSELVDRLQECLPDNTVAHKDRYDYVLQRTSGGRGGVIEANPVTKAIRELGLDGTTSETKFIPPEYLVNSIQVRLAVLQGLLDTDGGPVVQRDRSCRVQYTTVSARLRDDMRQLVQSLGGVAYVRTRSAAGRTPGNARGREVHFRHDAFVLDIRLPGGIEPFRLSRKRALYSSSTVQGRPQRYVHEIVPEGEAETVCIQVAAEDSLYVTDDYLVTHNTLNDSFIVLDEAQNTTPEQMKMFLTRLGFGSKMVVTGDITQIDLPQSASGLRLVTRVLEGIDDIHFARLTSDDVVRHSLVGRIVDAYTEYDARKQAEHYEREQAREFANRAERRAGAPRDHLPPKRR